MRTQTQSENRKDPFAELDEYDDYTYRSAEEYEQAEEKRRSSYTGNKSSIASKEPSYYIVTYAITAFLALGLHNILMPDTRAYRSGTYEVTEYTVTGFADTNPAPSFILDGTTYTLPLKVADLKADGWTVEVIDSDENETVTDIAEPDMFYDIYLYRGDCVVDASSDTYSLQHDISVDQLSIQNIYLTSDTEGSGLSIGISVGMSTDEMYEILDENTDSYEVSSYENSDYISIYSDTGFIMIDTWDGEVDLISAGVYE